VVMLRRMTTFEMEVRKSLEKMRTGDVGWRVLADEVKFKSAAHFNHPVAGTGPTSTAISGATSIDDGLNVSLPHLSKLHSLLHIVSRGDGSAFSTGSYISSPAVALQTAVKPCPTTTQSPRRSSPSLVPHQPRARLSAG
jgi:hypothetical protein